MSSLSIIIPCFNEEGNVEPLFKRIKSLLFVDSSIEFIIVDNGSTDSTNKKIISSELFKKKQIKLCCVKKNIGYGHGIMKGVYIAKSEIIGWCHADMQTDPYDLISAFKKYQSQLNTKNVVIKGRRINRNLFDSFFTSTMSIIASITFMKIINDINAQPKLFHKNFLPYLKNYPFDFSLDLFFLIMAKVYNFKIINHNVLLNKRLHGTPKGGGNIIGKIKLIKRTLSYIFYLRLRLWNT
tara:strand:+ start:146 stop:862 length:717 start_codon:yes stop_codon:yes gene_type:complete